METRLWIVMALALVALAYTCYRAWSRRGLERPDDLTKVRGWLAVLVAFLVILSPLQSLSALRAEIAAAELANPGLPAVAEWRSLTLQLWVILSAGSALSVYAGLLLALTSLRRAVRHAQVVLWLGGPVTVILIAVFVVPAPGLWGEAFKSAIAAAIWTAYLSRSKRVQARYGTGQDVGSSIPAVLGVGPSSQT